MDAAQELIDRGYAARRDGDLSHALELYTAGTEQLRAMNEPTRQAHAVRHIADIQSKFELRDEAEANYAEALAIYREQPATGKLDLANTLRGYALLMESLGDTGTAREMWAEAGELYHAVEVQEGVDEAERRLVLLR